MLGDLEYDDSDNNKTGDVADVLTDQAPPQVCLIGLEAILRDGQYVGHLRRGDRAHYLDT